MAGVSYFQRYAQRENHVTNNTLLVMRHLYQSGPGKLEQVLHDLLDDDKITLGPTFRQQIKEERSVPDALIGQEAFRLYFETKLSQALDLNQLMRHIDSIAAKSVVGEAQTILIGLSTSEMRANDAETVAAYGRRVGVVFRSVSFGNVARAVSDACADYEPALKAVVLDYIDFLESERLLYASEDRMLVAPCGTSYAENEQFGVYYDGADRPSRAPCRFFGVYMDKRISLVGEIKAVLVCGYDAGKIEVQTTERGHADDDMLGRIKGIIEATGYYDLKKVPHRYFVMERFEPTDLRKVSKGPIRGAQYLQLSPIIGKRDFRAMGARELAIALRGQSFPQNEGDPGQLP